VSPARNTPEIGDFPIHPRRAVDAAAEPRPATSAAPAKPSPTPLADTEAQAIRQTIISDPANPMVMFSLERCEFCWSVAKLFDLLGIPYRSAPLNSAALQTDRVVARFRRVLAIRTGANILPRVFFADEYMGGGVDTFDAYRIGSLQTLPNRLGVHPKDQPGLRPYDLLPKWMQPKS
jgi:cysteine synthase A